MLNSFTTPQNAVQNFNDTASSNYHLKNLEDLFIHYLLDPGNSEWSEEEKGDMHHTYMSIKELIQDISLTGPCSLNTQS